MSTTSSEANAGTGKAKVEAGMVMGADGKPCKPCTAFRNWKPTKAAAKKSTAMMMAGLAGGTSAVAAQDRPQEPPANCPPDVEQLGRATWTFLHSTAAYYPERPSPAQRASLFGLISALPVLYPCSHCAEHLGENMKHNPPDLSSGRAFSLWLCQRHNEVNARLGKEAFDCSKTDERWKDGPSDGRCD